MRASLTALAARNRLAFGSLLLVGLAAAAILASGRGTLDVIGVLAVLYLAGLLGVGQLVGRLRAELAATEQLALHDGLTKLPNRLLFEDRAAHALRGAQRGEGKVAIMLLDLDRFKEINDTLGHERGDRLLIEVTDRLAASLRASDTIARLGGDEFGLVVPVSDARDAHRVARRLLAQLDLPVAVDDLSLRVQASVGIALYPDDGFDTGTLVRKADVAMYQGKRAHLPVRYSASHDHYSPERLNLIGELKRAIEQHELVAHYQTIIDLPDGSVRAVEALVRWQHPVRGLISPAEFVGFAEQTGLMEQLTDTVLRIALPESTTWQQDGHGAMLTVNVSGRDLSDPDFGARVAGLLGEIGVEPTLLELEIPEDAVLADPKRILAALDRLRNTGVRIALDNFGAHHTSLHYLRKLHLDTLKIDRSFTHNLADKPDNQAIVRSTIELAHRLGVSVTAEGVETADTLALLTEYGCDLAQGRHISYPNPAAKLDLTPTIAASSFGPPFG